MNKKKLFNKASDKKRVASFLIDILLSFIILCLLIYLLLEKDNYETTLSLFLKKNTLIPWIYLFICLVIPVIPNTISIYLSSRTLGQILFNLKMRSLTNYRGQISFLQAFLKSIISYWSCLFFFSIPQLISLLINNKKSLSEKISQTLVLEKFPSKREKNSAIRVFAIFILLLITPSYFLFWKKIITRSTITPKGVEIFYKSKSNILEIKKERGFTKKIRKPKDFMDFFQELRWSLIWKDLERHMHLLTPSSKLLVSLNLDLYKKSLPEDIKFSHIQKTDRKNHYKLYYNVVKPKKQKKDLEFFYLTKKNEHWQLDHSKLFLNYYLGKNQ